jgi:hypothetical protein
MDIVPSVPSLKVDNFCSNSAIWSAKPALKACSSLRFANSVFFSLMRARRAGDWFDEVDALLMEPERRWEGMGRPNDIVDTASQSCSRAQEKELVMSGSLVLSRTR